LGISYHNTLVLFIIHPSFSTGLVASRLPETPVLLLVL
jgi:hypothetical protein